MGVADYLKDFRKMISLKTDAPTEFHEFLGLSLLSSLLPYNVVVRTSFKNIRPNVWTLLLGPSSESRKSTCIEIVSDMLHAVDADLQISCSFSPEGLFAELGGRCKTGACRGIFFIDEFGETLSKMKNKKYMADAKDLLMKLYDGKPNPLSTALKSGNVKLKDYYICFVGGITEERLMQLLTESDAKDGFLARFLLVRPDMSEHEERTPKYNPKSDVMFANLVNRLSDFYAAMMGKTVNFDMKEDAWEYYEVWSKEMKDGSDGYCEGKKALMARYQIYSLKFAALYFLAENMDTVRNVFTSAVNNVHLSIDYIEKASKLIDSVLPMAVSMVEDIELDPKLRRVRQALSQAYPEPMKHSVLLRQTHMSAWDFKHVIDTIHSREEIEVVHGKNEKGYSTVFYKWREEAKK